MAKIRSSNTKPELLAKDLLNGFQHQPKIYGRPDFINKKEKLLFLLMDAFGTNVQFILRLQNQIRNIGCQKLKEMLKELKKLKKNIRIWGGKS